MLRFPFASTLALSFELTVVSNGFITPFSTVNPTGSIPKYPEGAVVSVILYCPSFRPRNTAVFPSKLNDVPFSSVLTVVSVLPYFAPARVPPEVLAGDMNSRVNAAFDVVMILPLISFL